MAAGHSAALNYLFNNENLGFDAINLGSEKGYSVLEILNNFEKAVNDYLSAPTPETKEVIRELLSIEQEFLGFKYWIIKNNPTLFREFSNNIIWNK